MDSFEQDALGCRREAYLYSALKHNSALKVFKQHKMPFLQVQHSDEPEGSVKIAFDVHGDARAPGAQLVR